MTTHAHGEPVPDQPAHVCGNCEGIDPDTCLVNPDRPRTTPAPVDEQLRQRVALAIGAHRNGLASDGLGWFRNDEDMTECHDLAAAVLAALRPELDALAAHEEHRKGIAAALGHRNDALWDDLISTTRGCRNSRKRWKDRAGEAEAALATARASYRKLRARLVGFQDVLDDTDRGPWANTVNTALDELGTALDGPAEGRQQ